MMFVWRSVVFIFLLCQIGCITASVRWPGGRYSLPKPKTGCPEEDNGWKKTGKITQEILSTSRPANNQSDGLHMAGYVHSKQLEIHFCINNGTNPRNWPKGEYCIYSKYGIKNMPGGRIKLHDQNSTTTASQTCKDSFLKQQSNKYTSLYFKCQTGGNKRIPISLPITKPFYLLPYGSRDCQQVKWMVATSEWIKDYIYSRISQYCEVPYYEDRIQSHWKELKMYYCYYESCNNTLTDKKGVFKSPGFPGKYPDRQLCSWRIMVPDKHTLHVHFTNFSLYDREYDTDCLLLYKNNGHVMKLKQAFVGHQQPFTITATRDVMFVFRSDEKNNNTGFRAEYEIYKTPEKTTQPMTNPITTQPPTTTNFSSEKFSNKCLINPVKKTYFCDETWKIVVMVIPLAVSIFLLIIDIICRCRSKKASKSGESADDGMVVNPTYERGNIILDQPADTTTDSSMVTTATADDQPQSHDNPPDYEDVDYTQVDEIPSQGRSTKRQECLVLEPIGNDTSSVFFHVLEPPKTESDGPQFHARDAVGNGAPDMFYHTLESPSDSNRPTYQNLSELNHYTLNPVYESAEN